MDRRVVPGRNDLSIPALGFVPGGGDVEALVAAARLAGVGVHPITPLYAPSPISDHPVSDDRPDHPGLVIGYASLDTGDIAHGIERLAAVLASPAARVPLRRRSPAKLHPK
ncbi:hypothetical protein [Azospirillum sp. TSO35-2]|uniref:hypothetical protein n=1 Tax=Azospirillum sp. TSO35-2 TaxID=716796 RepID=UPI001FFF4FFE|nr:hypothetical protein [Azospirillum sp. TSO35-2]